MSLILTSAIALFVAAGPVPAGPDPAMPRTPAPAAAPAPAVVDPADGYLAFRSDRSLCLRATKQRAANRLGLVRGRVLCRPDAYWTAEGLAIHER